MREKERYVDRERGGWDASMNHISTLNFHIESLVPCPQVWREPAWQAQTSSSSDRCRLSLSLSLSMYPFIFLSVSLSISLSLSFCISFPVCISISNPDRASASSIPTSSPPYSCRPLPYFACCPPHAAAAARICTHPLISA